jgi:hypothetical protein
MLFCRHPAVAAVLAAAVSSLLGGCGGSGSTSAAATRSASASVAALSIAAYPHGQTPTGVSGACAPAETKPPATPPRATSLASHDLVEVVEATGLSATRITSRNENNDPENLIGRPGHYTSRVDWQDSRRKVDPDFPNARFAGILEVYPSSDHASTNSARLV